MVTKETARRELTAQDRCDSCSAPARVLATFMNGELLFCGHHARKAGKNLVLKALDVYDPEGEFNVLK